MNVIVAEHMDITPEEASELVELGQGPEHVSTAGPIGALLKSLFTGRHARRDLLY